MQMLAKIQAAFRLCQKDETDAYILAEKLLLLHGWKRGQAELLQLKTSLRKVIQFYNFFSHLEEKRLIVFFLTESGRQQI